jgi:hypothetical protein
MARSPLFDLYDPDGLLTGQSDYDIDPLTGRKRRRQIADLMPEEDRSSLLRSLANAGTSGLSGLGWILDTPGSLIRGTISGLAEGNPLKGVQSLLSPSDERVSGRDLLRQFGMASDEDTWSNFGTGLAAEVLTDPLTFLNPAAILGRGAYGAAGRATARAGMLDDVKLLAHRAGEARGRPMGTREFLTTNTPATLAPQLPGDSLLDFNRAARAKGLNPDDLLQDRLATPMEFRIPGMESGVSLSLGQNIDTRIARGLDDAGEFLTTNRYTAPLATRAVRAFDPTVMERLNRDDQWRARENFAQARQGEREFREQLGQYTRAAQRAGRIFDEPVLQNAVVDSIEAATPERLAALDPRSRLAIDLLENVPEFAEYRDFARDSLAQRQQNLDALGVQTPTMQSDTGLGFFPRQKARFARERIPTIPDDPARPVSAYERGERVYNLDDVVGMARRPYLQDLSREEMRRLMTGDQGAALRDRLFGAQPNQLADIMDEASAEMGVPLPYDTRANAAGDTIESLRAFLADPALTAAERAEPLQALQELQRQSRQMKGQLGELLRSSDRQFAETGRGLYDRHTSADLLRYGTGGARSEASANVVLDALERYRSAIPAEEVPGGGHTNLLEAAADLGFAPNRLRDILGNRLPGEDIASLSIPDRVINELRAVAPRTVRDPTSVPGRFWDSYTNAFKIGALANPAYHMRNLYSGSLSSLTAGGLNPIDLGQSMYAGYQAGRGNYAGVIRRLRNTPGFEHLTDDELVDEFLTTGARNRLGQGQINEADEGLANAAQNLLIGQDPQRQVPWVGEGGLLYDPSRTWDDWKTVRGVDFRGILNGREAPSQTVNPLLDLHERVGRRVEDSLRTGTYIEALRQGYSPDAAADLVAKAQVDYSPQAFTNFERKIKKFVPFYSYPRGIAPLVAENLLYRPGGLQGQITRAVSSGSRPSEDSFVPEDLRKTTAIQLPGEYGRDGNLQRYLTKIDLPWRGLVDLVSPSLGNTPLESASKTIQSTAMNLAGQLNPLVKAPLEMLMNRQMYSGRELSDLYSMLEQDLGPMGRPIEQLIVNAPGGSKLIGMLRTARDQRMTPLGRAGKIAFNTFSGFGVTDRDPDKARDQAARQMLTELLETVPGVRTYENLTVPEADLREMPKDQRDLYLLYKIIQSEAAKRGRERKKQQLAMDPMQMLGING